MTTLLTALLIVGLLLLLALVLMIGTVLAVVFLTADKEDRWIGR